MRCMTALDQRTKPAGRDGNHALLHGVEHDGQLGAAAFELGKVPAQALGGLVQGGFHGGELASVALGFDAGAEIAVGDAAGKGDDAAQTRGDAAGDPGGQRQSDDERDRARTRERRGRAR